MVRITSCFTKGRNSVNLTERWCEGSVVLVGVATGVIRSRGVGLERSALGVVVRGGGGGVVGSRGRILVRQTFGSLVSLVHPRIVSVRDSWRL